MNCMSDLWSVFGRDQGQGVERAYRYDEATDRIIRRVTDRSDMSVTFEAAPCPDDCEWNGSEAVAPFGRLEWEPTENPFAE